VPLGSNEGLASALSIAFGWLTVSLVSVGHYPYRRTGATRGWCVAKESSDLPIYFIALGFEVDQASETLLGGQLLHVRSLSAG
jgi:hypothetical protein